MILQCNNSESKVAPEWVSGGFPGPGCKAAAAITATVKKNPDNGT